MNNNHRQAFTLIEILLVIVILMMFIGSAVYYMSPALHAVKLEEGAARFQSMFKFAGAEAAQTGKRVRISFATTNDIEGNVVFIPHVSMEMNPISAPGEFTLLQEVSWLDSSILDLVTLRSVQRAEEDEDEEEEAENEEDEEEKTLAERLEESGNIETNVVAATSDTSDKTASSDKKSSASSSSTSNSKRTADIPLAFTNKNEFYAAMEGNITDGDMTIAGADTELEDEKEDDPMEDMELSGEEEELSILFYPDGSSDSVTIKLVSVDEEDTREAILRLNGITGFVELRYVQTKSDTDTEEDEEKDEDEEKEEISEDAGIEEELRDLTENKTSDDLPGGTSGKN